MLKYDPYILPCVLYIHLPVVESASVKLNFFTELSVFHVPIKFSAHLVSG